MDDGVRRRRFWPARPAAALGSVRPTDVATPGQGARALSPGGRSGPGRLRRHPVATGPAVERRGAGWPARPARHRDDRGGRLVLRRARGASSSPTPHRSGWTSLVLLCAAYGGLDPTPTAEAFGEEEERLIEAGDVDGAVALNVSTWLGPDADDAARDLVRLMQRRAFEMQMPADEWADPPSLVREDPDLASFTAPTHVVSGGHDLDHFQNIARHLAAEIPDAHLIELDWAGHLPSMERPAETAPCSPASSPTLTDVGGGRRPQAGRAGRAPGPCSAGGAHARPGRPRVGSARWRGCRRRAAGRARRSRR